MKNRDEDIISVFNSKLTISIQALETEMNDDVRAYVDPFPTNQIQMHFFIKYLNFTEDFLDKLIIQSTDDLQKTLNIVKPPKLIIEPLLDKLMGRIENQITARINLAKSNLDRLIEKTNFRMSPSSKNGLTIYLNTLKRKEHKFRYRLNDALTDYNFNPQSFIHQKKWEILVGLIGVLIGAVIGVMFIPAMRIMEHIAEVIITKYLYW